MRLGLEKLRQKEKAFKRVYPPRPTQGPLPARRVHNRYLLVDGIGWAVWQWAGDWRCIQASARMGWMIEMSRDQARERLRLFGYAGRWVEQQTIFPKVTTTVPAVSGTQRFKTGHGRNDRTGNGSRVWSLKTAIGPEGGESSPQPEHASDARVRSRPRLIPPTALCRTAPVKDETPKGYRSRENQKQGDQLRAL